LKKKHFYLLKKIENTNSIFGENSALSLVFAANYFYANPELKIHIQKIIFAKAFK